MLVQESGLSVSVQAELKGLVRLDQKMRQRKQSISAHFQAVGGLDLQ